MNDEITKKCSHPNLDGWHVSGETAAWQGPMILITSLISSTMLDPINRPTLNAFVQSGAGRYSLSFALLLTPSP